MALINSEIPSTQKKIDVPLVCVASSTSGGSYLMFGLAGAATVTGIWVPDVACTLYALSVSFINTANSSNTVYFCMYRAGNQYGATTATAMSSTRQNVYSTGLSTAISAGDQIEIACFPSGSPGGTLSSQAFLHVVYS